MSYVFHYLAIAFDWLMAPLYRLHPWVGMIAISVITTVFVLIVYKYTSNQAAILRAKDRIKAHLMAMSLYKDSLRIIGASVVSIFWMNLRYLALNIVPLLFMILPVSLVMANLDGWFGYAPLEVGEHALLVLELDPDDCMRDDLRLTTSSGVVVDAPPVRVPSKGEITWRIRPVSEGRHEVNVELGEKKIVEQIYVGGVSERLSVKRGSGDLLESFLYPGKPIPTESGVRSLRLTYSTAEMNAFGWELHWVYVYLILTLVLAFASKGLFKVTF